MRLVVNILLGVLISASAVMAQTSQGEPIKALPAKSSAIQWLITAVFLVATLVVAFKPAKRSKLE